MYVDNEKLIDVVLYYLDNNIVYSIIQSLLIWNVAYCWYVRGIT